MPGLEVGKGLKPLALWKLEIDSLALGTWRETSGGKRCSWRRVACELVPLPSPLLHPSWLSSPHRAIPEGLCIDNISALRGFVVLQEVAGSHRKNIGCCGRTQKFLVPRWGEGRHLGGKESKCRP